MRRPALLALIPQAAQQPEGAAQFRLVGVECRHGHQAAQIERRQREHVVDELRQCRRLDSALLRLRRAIHLQQHPLPRAGHHPPRDVPREVGPVHRVNQREPARDEPGLAPLHRADEVPANLDAGKRILLLDRFLHPVLAHVAQAGREGLAHRVGRMRLRDRDDGDGMAAPRPGQAAVDRLADGRQPVNQVMGCHNLGI